MIKKYLGLLSFLFIFIACTDDIDDNILPNKAMAPSTVLAYFIADNDLQDDLANNIQAMYLGLQSIDEYSADLFIYWDGSINDSISFKITDKDGTYSFKTKNYWKKPVILRYTCDGNKKINGSLILKPIGKKKTNESLKKFYTNVFESAEVVLDYNSQNSSDINVMSTVLSDMIKFTKTDKVGLVAGSHASSWLPASSSRAFGDDMGKAIQVSDMADAIASTKRTLDFILFDACLMGSIEVCYDFRSITNYQIASVLEIPAYGFPYDLMLNYLYEGNKEGYTKACQTYIDFYNIDKNCWGTISLVDSKEINNLTQIVKREILSHKDILENFDITEVQEYGRKSQFQYCSVDLKQFVTILNDNNIPNDFNVQLNKTVVYKGCIEKKNTHYLYQIDEENYCGLGVYVPKENKHDWNTYFKTTAWYKAAGWDEISFDWYF